MTVNWKSKCFSFDYQGAEITLQGVQSDLTLCAPISIHELAKLEQNDSIWSVVELLVHEVKVPEKTVPEEIQNLIQQFDKLFQEPKGIPPHRSSSHTIPLIPGAQPFRLRPYRYNPAQKNEIEQQVTMLSKN